MNTNITRWYRFFGSVIMGVTGLFMVYIVYDIVNHRIVNFDNYTDWRVNVAGILAFVCFYQLINIVNKRFDKYLNWRDDTKKRFFLQFTLDFLLVILISIPVGWFISGLLAADKKIDYVEDALIIGGVSAFVILLLVIFELTAFFLTEWKYAHVLVERFAKKNLEYRFDRLKEQLNPHFLFNNLNTLYGLIGENPEQASKFVIELADIYRYVLKNKDEEVVWLKDELDFTNSYIFLISNRYIDSIRFEVDLPETIFNSKIPPLTLQMLIENAIKHNSFDKGNPLKIKIYMLQNKIVVENKLKPVIRQEETGQIGLRNLKERYLFLSGQEVEVKKTRTMFAVSLPLINFNPTALIKDEHTDH
jgi:hypothetical protein